MKKGFLIFLYGFFLLGMVPLTVWWLFQARTAVGVAIAVLGLITAVLPYTIYRRNKRGITLLLAAGLGIVGWIVLAAPDGRTILNSPISHQFTKDTPVPRYSLGNLIPEADQVNLGWQVMPYVDPIMTVAQGKRTAVPTFAIYDEMAQDEDFAHLGSVMGWAYGELAGRPFDMGHYYLYDPQPRLDNLLPALVFLHGSAGNFQSYTWLLSKLANEKGFVVIAPSFGFGNWRQEGGVTAVLNALDHAQTVTNIDPTQVYLMGLSNGGLGVSLTANAAPERFAGLIFLSPVFATEIVDEEPFLSDWQEKPILVMTGEADRRIPIGYVRERVEIWQGHGLPLTVQTFPNEDHFLFFTQADEVLAVIGRWWDEN
jgi:phospholipase/carboxylesterase